MKRVRMSSISGGGVRAWWRLPRKRVYVTGGHVATLAALATELGLGFELQRTEHFVIAFQRPAPPGAPTGTGTLPMATLCGHPSVIIFRKLVGSRYDLHSASE